MALATHNLGINWENLLGYIYHIRSHTQYHLNLIWVRLSTEDTYIYLTYRLYTIDLEIASLYYRRT